jgi:hypothetical protein
MMIVGEQRGVPGPGYVGRCKLGMDQLCCIVHVCRLPDISSIDWSITESQLPFGLV